MMFYAIAFCELFIAIHWKTAPFKQKNRKQIKKRVSRKNDVGDIIVKRDKHYRAIEYTKSIKNCSEKVHTNGKNSLEDGTATEWKENE